MHVDHPDLYAYAMEWILIFFLLPIYAHDMDNLVLPHFQFIYHFNLDVSLTKIF